LTPILTLYGFQREDVEVIYQHEDAPDFVQIPPLPMAWDLKTLDEYRSLVRRESLPRQPPPRFRAFFQKEKDGEWKQNAFGKLMAEIYEKDRLRRFGYGARLLRWLPTREMREELDQKIARWEHIWIGDQIPETVEHSRGHSARLMEYAAELLEPIFERQPEWLTSEELYCLICCLWLHDIGHTSLELFLPDEPMKPNEDTNSRLAKFRRYLGLCGIQAGIAMEPPPSVNPRRIRAALFPSLVRLFHNFLSAQRICDPQYGYLHENERDAVALISMYDRAEMPLVGDGWWEEGEIFGLMAPSLEQMLGNGGLSFRSETLDKEKVLLLCALLRVLDGLDIQSDRTVNEPYRQERCQRTQEEVNYYHSLWEEKYNKSSQGERDQLECLNKQLMALHDEWAKSLESGDLSQAKKVREEAEERIKSLLLPLVQEAFKGEDLARLEMLGLADRILFKMAQEAHFRKHSCVKLVYMVPTDPTQQVYKIYMTFDKELELDKQQRKEIAKEVWEEVKKVSHVLQKSSINFDGIFDAGTDASLWPNHEEDEEVSA
jgi:hypothetical protein